jgi:hypothetical protein
MDPPLQPGQVALAAVGRMAAATRAAVAKNNLKFMLQMFLGMR